MHPDLFFQQLWRDYIQMTPQAERIQKLFLERGEAIVTDHIAFRTLNLAPIQISALEPHLLKLGYQPYEPYEFTEKKLQAWGYVHTEALMPRIFLSELKCESFSSTVQNILEEICQQIDPDQIKQPSVFWSGRLWDSIAWQDYQALLAESEYAAWVAALGLRPNHFTLSVNHLKKSQTLDEVLAIVEHQNIPLNLSGGRIKGSPSVLLEQGSTLADRLPVEFANQEIHQIPTCYYEFARRYPMADGTLYPGFVAASADRIFESTHAK